MEPVWILIIFAVAGAIAGIITYYGWWRSQRLPNNRPAKFVRCSQKSKIVVFLGDSITHGAIGADFTSLVAEKIDNPNYEYVNAGINGELAWNVLQRLDEIIRLQPDILILMIGSNDAMGSLSSKDAKLYRRSKGIPQDPSVEWYKENLISITKEIQQQTKARIALASIPVLTEDPTHGAFERSIEISNVVKAVAMQLSVTYIPFNEEMAKFVMNNPSNPKFNFENRLQWMIIAIFKHYVLRKSWDRISSDSGFNILIDHVHLNKKGAEIIAGLIFKSVTETT